MDDNQNTHTHTHTHTRACSYHIKQDDDKKGLDDDSFDPSSPQKIFFKSYFEKKMTLVEMKGLGVDTSLPIPHPQNHHLRGVSTAPT